MEKVTQILQERSASAVKEAKKIILSEKLECRAINEAFEYYAQNWAGYIHLGLISIACEAVNGNPNDVIPIQVAMSLLTAAIDLHDDIIDESRTKYGKSTLFGRSGKDITLLVGDAFMIKALTLLHKLQTRFSLQRINAIWDLINNQLFELGDAEALEASLKGNVDIFPEKYLSILEKRAANFEIHMRIGAIIGGGEQNEIRILGDYGRTLGTLAGIREDYADIFEPDELQNRIKNEILPLPILYAFKNPVAKKALICILSKPKISKKDAEKIVDIVSEEKNVQMFRTEIQQLAKKALKNISKISNQNARIQMQMLIEGAIEDL